MSSSTPPTHPACATCSSSSEVRWWNTERALSSSKPSPLTRMAEPTAAIELVDHRPPALEGAAVGRGATFPQAAPSLPEARLSLVSAHPLLPDVVACPMLSVGSDRYASSARGC